MSKKIELFATLVADFAFLAGCTTPEQKAAVYAGQEPPTADERAMVLRTLKAELHDPYSVRDARISDMLFPSRTLSGTKTSRSVCVSFNAKNRYGAYTGVSKMYLRYSAENHWLGPVIDDVSQSICGDSRLHYNAFPELEAA